MGLVIKTDLPEYSPVYNQMEVCIWETTTIINFPSFKYIFDIVTENHGTVTLKATPEPMTGEFFGVQD